MTPDSRLAGLTLAERRKLLDMARARDLVRAPELPPIEPAPRDARVPLSFAQQRLWFLEQMGGLGSAYHLPRRMRLRGELDRAALARALDAVVARHEALRTTFAETDGVPEQRIAPAGVGFRLAEHDLGGRADAEAELERLLAAEVSAPFDLARGPLIRGVLVRLADDDHVLFLVMHHIVSDGWSMGVLTRELNALYAAFRAGEPDPLAPLPIQYADFAVWQRRSVGGEAIRTQADYWKATLGGAPELLELPTDRPRPAVMEHGGARADLVLDEALTAALTALGRRHGATLFMTLLAGWAVVLGRLSGQDDLVVGTPTAGRGRREIEGLVGLFLNTLAVRADLSGDPTVTELLGRVRERALGAQHHQDIPFEQVVELLQPARSMAHTPLFQVLFAWQNTLAAGQEPAGPAQPPAGQSATAHFDLSLSLAERGGRIVGGVEYATALFDRETIERHLDYLRRVLEAMVADERQRVSRLALMSAAERLRVSGEWSANGAAYPAGPSLHERFEAQVARAPGAVAVVFGDERLTYAELNARANRLAHRLRALGVGPDARVAVCLERGPALIVGLLGVLKAGGGYVPLDPAYPDDRIRHVLDDSAPVALLAQAATAGRFAYAGVPIVALDAGEAWWAGEAETNPSHDGADPHHLAYVIYTSGSTGRPKGVMVEHHSVCQQVAAITTLLELRPGERSLQFASAAFDASVEEIFGALLSGATLVLRGDDWIDDAGAFWARAEAHGINVMSLPTRFWQLLAADPSHPVPSCVRRVVIGGEAVEAAALSAWFAAGGHRPRLLNTYGPTESTVNATAGEVTADASTWRSIGRPVPHTRAYLLDAHGQPVPVGVAGEIHVGGGQVARGYLGRPGLTAERFIPDPFGEPGARLYRTGDLGRWRADGTIEFAGRNDFQVKIRGFRIEPGEIEARLAEHPAVREAVVLAREDVPGEKRLVAYHVGGDAGAEALRAHLAERLPDYMVPAAYVRLEAFPTTPGGKVNRKALPAPEGDAFAARAYEPPAGETEQALAGIWAEVLRAPRVGRWDNFFELGGHSLLAVQVISRVRQALHVEAALGDLFARPVLGDFARELETAARAELPPIEPAPRDGRLPLSFAQRRLWFLEQMGDLGGAYHITQRLRLRGPLDRAALARALDRIVARHEALRTTFAEVNGVPEQRIAPAEIGFHLVKHDLAGRADADAELGRLLAGEARAPFDLERGPLVRGVLVRLAEDDHALLLTMHHIVSDGWSMGVLTRELAALYAAFRAGAPDPLAPLPIQYADFAVWQRRWVEGEILRQQSDYWTRTLAGSPELLELPTDLARPAQQDFSGGMVGIELDEQLAAALKALSRRHGATLFMTLLAGWAVVLSRLSGQSDVVIGTPAAGRGRREIEGLIGFFVNTLALRVDLSGSPAIADVLGRVKERALAAQQNQDIPFEQVVELVDPVRSLSHGPLFQAMFTWHDAPSGDGFQLPGLDVGSVAAGSVDVRAKFDLSLALGERDGRIVGAMTYATALFTPETVERWLGYLRRVLEEMTADETRPVERLALMPAGERSLLVDEWNRTEADFPREASVHHLCETQAERTPNAVAVVFEDDHLTYAELNRRANRLAHHLRAMGVGPDARVAVCVDRGLEMIVGLLAVLKAGGAYVPLDPAYPAERLRDMLDDCAPVAVLTGSASSPALGGVLDESGAAVVDLSEPASAWAEMPETNPTIAVRPHNLAYVIYTSGSTGRPKGVMVEHRSLVNHTVWQAAAFGIGAGDTVLQRTSISFDASVWELWTPLSTGARMLVLSSAAAKDPAAIGRAVGEGGVTVAQFVPTLLQAVLAARPAGVSIPCRILFCGGEALPAALVDEARAAGVGDVVNLYGPTEATIDSTSHVCVPDGRAPAIGRPIANARIYVLDACGEPVPVGVTGELFIGGAGVARGYLRRAGLTAERFIPDPFSAEPGARMYRTGDLGRRRADGTLEFVGRADFQVKVRGFRIEPGEIEARLREHAGVREAVVLALDDGAGGKRLVGYYVGDALAGEALRAHLTERLPEYMVPAAFVRLEALPLTPNGKLDRKALPAPDGDAFATREYQAPAGETEQALAEIWAEVLGVERVGRHDHFFELGGHSLLTVQVISRVRQVLGVEVALGELFARPVLADFAREVENAARADLPPIERAPRAGPLPLSFAQQRLWFLEQMGRLDSTYHIPGRLRLRGDLDRAALARALDRIVARHEALRTTFAHADGVPEQRIAPVDVGFHLIQHDLSARADAEAVLGRLTATEMGEPFSLERGPLIRGRLIRIADNDHVLLLTMHHIVSDAWSTGVLTRELSALYGAFSRGEPDPLPALPVQYADYAAWQRQWAEGELLRQQADYWTRTLAGAPELLELPTDHPRPARQDFSGGVLGIELGAELTAEVKALSRRHGTTLFMTLLAGWAVVLSRLSGQRDVVIGTPSANRGRREIEGLIGFFVNTLALRVDLSGAASSADVLGRVKARSLEAQQNQDIPFEQVVDLVQPARSMAHTPLFQVMFAWQSAPSERLALPGLTLAPAGAAAQVTAKFDLMLSLGESGGRIAGAVEYAAALFDAATVERWLGYLRRVLEEMVADDSRPVERLALMPATERALVLDEWNRTEAEYPRDACVHQLFEAQVARNPDATAVVFDRGALTYAELNARANRLAHHLRSLGVGPDARVALAIPRSPALVEAELAVLKSGGAYVPLDPDHPPERLRDMLADSAPAALLTTHELAGRFADLSIPVLEIDAKDQPWASHPATNLPVDGLTARHLAYVMYTSGSTGRPKGVMVAHRAIVRLVINNGYAAFGPDDRVTFAANPAFDATTMEVWAPLVNGGTLVIVGHDALLDPTRFATALRTHEVSVLWLTVGLFNQYAEALADDWRRLRYLIVGGDALDPRVISRVLRHGPPAHLLNGYGPTETTTFAVTHEIRQVDEGARGIPLGRPIGNTRVYIIDRVGQPAPIGVAGEMYIGGDGVARGYQGRPAQTAERFVADPFGGEPGARLYRTGDLGRWRADGTIEFLGRTDQQVKVRGFRIELGEIEARLAEHPAVREAVVLAREDVPGEKRLVAYFVGQALETDALRAHLSMLLPEYMVPAAYVRLEAFPVTPNGKLDRRALPAPDADAFGVGEYDAPLGETEAALADIWAELLGVERVGRGDDFFALGGHSLLAVRVISRVRETLGVEAAICDLFVRPVLADFARGVERASRAELPPIERVKRGADLPVSFAQQRLWFIDRMEGAGVAYHIPVHVRLTGELDRPALRRALDAVVARHETLRTVFAEVDGEPVQRIAPAGESPFQLAAHDLRGHADAGSELRRIVAEETDAPFDLARGPLIRGRLVRVADEDHVLLITMHHIVSDGWSMGVLTRELSALYAAFRAGEPDPLPPLPIQYADYAAWQRKWVEGKILRAQAEYWKKTLGGAPELLELPADHARPARQDFSGGAVRMELSAELTAELKALGARHGATLFMTLLAGWAAVLSRLSGQDDVVVGTPTANRGRSEIEGLIGFFVNTLAVRVNLSGSPSVAGLLARVKERALGAQHHQDIPFEQVVELVQPARSLAHTPLFQVMFAWQNAPEGGLALPGLAPAPLGHAGAAAQVTAKFDLSLALSERGGRIVGVADHATALFERATVERWLGYLRRVLEEMAADETRPVERLALMPASERSLLVHEWNRTDAAYPRESCVHQLFEAQTERTPHAVAVVFGDDHLTYAELNRRANQLAHHLRALGVRPDTRVAVCVERGLGMMVGLLAVLKAGGAYVPLDPAYPAERLRHMLDDCAPVAVLTDGASSPAVGGLLDGCGAAVVDLSAPAWADLPETNPAIAVGPHNLAYVIYTSGSTGRPKGVMVEHRSLVNHTAWQAAAFGIGAGDTVLQRTSISFDASVWELWTPLATGARMLLLSSSAAKDPAAIGRAVADGGVTVAQFVPLLLQAVLGARAEGALLPCRTLFCGGEPLPAALVDEARTAGVGEVVNLYGPTEATIDSTSHVCVPDGRAPSIGRPISNARIYVLDARGEPVPVGVTGEICVGGAGVARGYLRRAALTAERFIPDPFSAEPGARMYRTGDLGRRRADGALEFVGRTDFQVKVRGFRIEPGEIEARLREHGGVREAVVIAREDVPGDRRLVAYVVGDAAGADVLRAHVGAALPEHMIPAAIVSLDRLPLTPNGKLDRAALPAPEYAAPESQFVAPRTPTEARLAGIWAEVLRIDRVGVHDGFFALGGHSLLATRAVSRVRDAFGVELPLRAIFETPTVAGVAPRVDALVMARVDERELADALAELDQLSEDEVRALLNGTER